MRKVFFANDEIYHIFNRGVELRPTFTDKREYKRGQQALNYYRFAQLPFSFARALVLETSKRAIFFDSLAKERKLIVELICYCLMPNHFHILIRQKRENGISKFLSNFTNSYTRYFNTKHKRIGPLFQGTFKAVRIESEDQLLHVNRYIHLNPIVSFVVKNEDVLTYPGSSLSEYFLRKDTMCDTSVILSHFRSIGEYKKFLWDQIDYGKSLEAIKHLTME